LYRTEGSVKKNIELKELAHRPETVDRMVGSMQSSVGGAAWADRVSMTEKPGWLRKILRLVPKRGTQPEAAAGASQQKEPAVSD
jgi:hypothetical protein